MTDPRTDPLSIRRRELIRIISRLLRDPKVPKADKTRLVVAFVIVKGWHRPSGTGHRPQLSHKPVGRPRNVGFQKKNDPIAEMLREEEQFRQEKQNAAS